MALFRKFAMEKRVFSVDGRCFLLESLVDEKGAEATPYLLDALTEEWPMVRACAVRLLGECSGQAGVVEGLARALMDRDAMVRRNAVEALRRITPVPVAAMPALLRALDDEDTMVGQVALLALKRIQDAMVAHRGASLRREVA